MAMNQDRGHATEIEPPGSDLPHAPDAVLAWRRASGVAVGAAILLLLDRSTVLLMDYWMLDSLELGAVFWTNFQAGFSLFVFGFAGAFLAIALPSMGKDLSPAWRRLVIHTAILAGLVFGYVLIGRYQDILLLFGGVATGEVDPVFGRDVGFFMFELPGYWVIWTAVTVPVLLGLVANAALAVIGRPSSSPVSGDRSWAASLLLRLATPAFLVHVAILGTLVALAVWLSRFDLLWKDNYPSSIYSGAEYLDVSGVVSYLSRYLVRSVLVLAGTVAVVLGLSRLRSSGGRRGEGARTDRDLRRLGLVLASLVAIDLAFTGSILLRDAIGVVPNEPVIQLPYIERHIQATLRGYDLENVETVEFLPNGPDDPLPAAEDLLASATLRQAPLWPGWVSYLERVLDPQHADRVLMTAGESVVYGPTLDAMRAQQKLRSYYDFLDIDTVRVRQDGELHLLVSAVRELPFTDPQPWIAWWGQRMLLFTHGHGLVAASTGRIRGEGDPDYLAYGIPARSDVPGLHLENPRVYYGEGAGVMMGFSNAGKIDEFDYPTDEERQEVVFPPSIEAGVTMDSWLKRLVVGWRSGSPTNVWFSDLLDVDSRVHYAREPLARLDRIAPFLYFDSDPVAVAHEGRIHWLANGITTSDRYPYSRSQILGDQSIQQSLAPRDRRRVNYVRDSVKAVLDAYTGKVTLYRITQEPVVRSWENVYPSLFRPGHRLPRPLWAHAQYPVQLMHVQFDDIYYKYHMSDPLTFFNMEDMWDDADEVKGAVLDEGDSVTFSMEPRLWIAETGGVLPAAEERDQFVLSMVFTNEQALNLRAIPIAYQDGADYGRLIVLRVPKGHFFPGPEQADAALDQDPAISEQISWWNRTGSSVIRGHTSTLVVGNEVIYVEPLFTRSRQNPVSQMRRVLVVFRGHAASGDTLEEALRAAIAEARTSQSAQSGAAAPDA